MVLVLGGSKVAGAAASAGAAVGAWLVTAQAEAIDVLSDAGGLIAGGSVLIVSITTMWRLVTAQQAATRAALQDADAERIRMRVEVAWRDRRIVQLTNALIDAGDRVPDWPDRPPSSPEGMGG